jgi:ferredoxin-NADP reductase
MDAKSLQSLVPRIADSDVYIFGPERLVEVVRKAADCLGIPQNWFNNEAFTFHSQ